MCTLTYSLHQNGYELFFNRDEQRSRVAAIQPQFSSLDNAIYPVDPQGGGTWLAVNQHGLSLALLNNYQATNHQITGEPRSRGQLIILLLKMVKEEPQQDINTLLAMIDLSVYQPFQLCIFPSDLSLGNDVMSCVIWNGQQLVKGNRTLPITSSSVDFNAVFDKRCQKYQQLVDIEMPLPEQLNNFHHSTDEQGKFSVNMQRSDAKTVSISHICVTDKITFDYLDNVTHAEECEILDRVY